MDAIFYDDDQEGGVSKNFVWRITKYPNGYIGEYGQPCLGREEMVIEFVVTYRIIAFTKEELGVEIAEIMDSLSGGDK